MIGDDVGAGVQLYSGTYLRDLGTLSFGRQVPTWTVARNSTGRRYALELNRDNAISCAAFTFVDPPCYIRRTLLET